MPRGTELGITECKPVGLEGDGGEWVDGRDAEQWRETEGPRSGAGILFWIQQEAEGGHNPVLPLSQPLSPTIYSSEPILGPKYNSL